MLYKYTAYYVLMLIFLCHQNVLFVHWIESLSGVIGYGFIIATQYGIGRHHTEAEIGSCSLITTFDDG
jgi:hypothetical protein